MSAATKAALDEAIEAHLRDESTDGAMVTAYVLYIAYINPEIPAGRTAYSCLIPEGQPYHSTLGLAHSLIEDMITPPDVEDD